MTATTRLSNLLAQVLTAPAEHKRRTSAESLSRMSDTELKICMQCNPMLAEEAEEEYGRRVAALKSIN